MTKQQIFSLYLANENQKVMHSDSKDTYCLNGVAIGDEVVLQSATNEHFSTGAKLSDCRLVLKPIAEMSEEDLQGVCKALQLGGHYSNSMKRHLMGDDTLVFCMDNGAKITLFLITHGYALDDTYFTNGIAIKE